MRALPPPERRVWLLEQLDWLLEDSGRTRFCQGPLAEGRLPTTWLADQASVEALLRTLMSEAGLDKLEVHVELHELPSELLSLAGDQPSRGAPAWVALLLDNQVTFGVERARLRDESLLGSLCREVARVWRLARGLSHDDSELEELLVDLTSIYLGFGLPVLRRAWALRAAPIAVIGQHLSPAAGGYLPPQSVSYVLAAQLLLHDGGRRNERSILGQLEPNQQALLREGLSYLRGPGKQALNALRGDPKLPDIAYETPPRPVQRVRTRSGLRGMIIGALIGAAVGLLGVAVFKAPQTLGLIPVCAVLLGAAGWFTKSVSCSGCGARLAEDDVLCGSCGGLVTGDTDKLL